MAAVKSLSFRRRGVTKPRGELELVAPRNISKSRTHANTQAAAFCVSLPLRRPGSDKFRLGQTPDRIEDSRVRGDFFPYWSHLQECYDGSADPSRASLHLDS